MKKMLAGSLTLIAFTCGIWAVPLPARAYRDLPDDNLSYPVAIADDMKPRGSGLYFREGSKIFLVTARHVLFALKEEDKRKRWSLKFPRITCTSFEPSNPDDSETIFAIDLKKANAAD
jgi:hypothetical protein